MAADALKWQYDVFEEMSKEDQEKLAVPLYGWGSALLGKALVIMHGEMFGEENTDCVWTGGPVNDLIRCAHGYMVYAKLIARTMGMERN